MDAKSGTAALLMIAVFLSLGTIYLSFFPFFAINAANQDPTNGTETFDSKSAQVIGLEGVATPIRDGDAKVLSRLVISNSFVDPDNSCELCTRIIYTPGANKVAGLAYKDEKLNLDDSGRIVFFARSNTNEKVSFVAAGNDTRSPIKNDTDVFPRINFSVVTQNVTLNNDWKRLEIGLNNSNLTDASYPFGVQLASPNSNAKQIIYLKGITIDSKPAKEPLPEVYDALNSSSTNSTSHIFSTAINSNSTNGTAPTAVQFTANATGGAAPYSFVWNFNDASNSTGVGDKVVHTFTSPGTYNVTLSAKDSGSPIQNATASTVISVISVPPSVNSSDSRADNFVSAFSTAINSNSTNGTAPTAVQFTANATGGAAPYSFVWNFNDASNSTGVGDKVVHTFTSPGTYNVTLSAKDSGSPIQNATASTLISVIQPATHTINSTNSVSNNSTNSVSNNSTNSVSNNSTNSVSNNSTNSVSNNSTNSVSNNEEILNSRLEYAHLSRGLALNATNGDKPNLHKDLNENSVLENRNTYENTKVNGSQPTVSISTYTSQSDSSINNNALPQSKTIRVSGDDLSSEMPVDSINHPPLVEDKHIAIDGGRDAKVVLRGSDPDKDLFTFDIVTPPTKGTLGGLDKEKGTVSYIASDTSSGSDAFTFKAIDSEGAESRTGTIYITIAGRTSLPSLQDIGVATPSDQPAEILLKAVDPDGTSNVFKFGILTMPLHGKLTGPTEVDDGSAKVTYVPANGYIGQDSFKYTVESSDNTQSKPAEVRITVFDQPKAINLAPSANSQSQETIQNKVIRISLSGHDPEGKKLEFSIVSNPLHGKLIGFESSNGKLAYQPSAKFVGQDSFTFKVTDDSGMVSNIAQVSIKVNPASTSESDSKNKITAGEKGSQQTSIIDEKTPVLLAKNERPSANAGGDAVIVEGTPVKLNGTGSDSDRTALSYLWKQVAGPTVELKGAHTPSPTFIAPAIVKDKLLSFRLTVIDPNGAEDSDIVKIVIRDKPLSDSTHSVGLEQLLPTGNNTHTGD